MAKPRGYIVAQAATLTKMAPLTSAKKYEFRDPIMAQRRSKLQEMGDSDVKTEIEHWVPLCQKAIQEALRACIKNKEISGFQWKRYTKPKITASTNQGFAIAECL
jgi:hypothetical protein